MPKKSSGTKPSKKILDNKQADAVSVSPNVVRTTKAKIVQPIKDTPIAKRKIVPVVRKTKPIITERPTTPSSLPEILGAAGDAPKISTPVPRTGPAQPNSVLERMLNIKWSKFIPATKIPTVKQIAAMMMAHKKELMFGGALGGGKFVGETDSILTPTGFCKNTELSEGSTITGSDGKSQEITQWKNWEELPCFRITFHDETFLDVPADHQWTAWRSGRARKENGIRLFGEDSKQVISTTTMKQWHETAISVQGKVTQTPWVLIPIPKPCEFTNTLDCQIDPYILGALLGDGYIGNKRQNDIKFTCSSDDYRSHWKNVFAKYTSTTDTKDDGNKSIRLIYNSRKEVFNELVRLNLYGCHSRTKFIPQTLLHSSIQNREALLQGLIDTDGYVDSRGQVYYCSVSDRLRNDVAWLVRSLGGVVTEFDENELYIKLPDQITPCRLNRKLDRLKIRNCSLYKRVISVIPIGKKRGRCVSVSNTDGLYITNDFIITHNSEWLAMEALRYCDLPSFSAIIFRRQLTDLKMPGSLIPRIAGWMQPHVDSGIAKYSGDEHKWTFKTCYPNTDIPGPDATLQFGYIGEATIRDRYQSAEFQLVEFEELGQWADDVDYLFMHTRLRKIVCPTHGKMPDGTPIYVPKCPYCDTLSAIDVRLRSASNPGPAWMKRRFGIVPDPAIYKTRHDALVAIQEGHKIHWIGSNPERPFIASYLDDNPHLNAKEYKLMLKEMSEEERSRLEDGNWEARKDARFKRKHERLYYLNAPPQYLKAFATENPNDHVEPIDLKQCSYSFIETDRQGNEVVSDPIPLSSLSEIFTTVDTAVTVRQGPIDSQLKQKNSASVISTWGITHDHALLYLNLRKFRKEIPDLVDNLVQVNNIWHVRRNKVECNGVGVGTAQYSEAAGLRIEKIYQQNDKIHNSTGAQMLMRAGRVFFPANAEWLEIAEDDIFSWTGLPAEDDDVIDTFSNASSELSLAAAPTISAPARKRASPIAVGVHQTKGGIPTYGLRQ